MQRGSVGWAGRGRSVPGQGADGGHGEQTRGSRRRQALLSGTRDLVRLHLRGAEVAGGVEVADPLLWPTDRALTWAREAGETC